MLLLLANLCISILELDRPESCERVNEPTARRDLGEVVTLDEAVAACVIALAAAAAA